MTLSLDILDRLIASDTVSNRSNLDLISYFMACQLTLERALIPYGSNNKHT